MDLYTIELVARKVLEMWNKHPDLCPHEYHFYWSQENEEHYKCEICGHEEVRMKGGE